MNRSDQESCITATPPVGDDALLKLHPYVYCPQLCSSMHSRKFVHVVRGSHTEIRVKDQLTS